jgi:hypothetical protein
LTAIRPSPPAPSATPLPSTARCSRAALGRWSCRGGSEAERENRRAANSSLPPENSLRLAAPLDLHFEPVGANLPAVQFYGLDGTAGTFGIKGTY